MEQIPSLLKAENNSCSVGNILGLKNNMYEFPARPEHTGKRSKTSRRGSARKPPEERPVQLMMLPGDFIWKMRGKEEDELVKHIEAKLTAYHSCLEKEAELSGHRSDAAASDAGKTFDSAFAKLRKTTYHLLYEIEQLVLNKIVSSKIQPENSESIGDLRPFLHILEDVQNERLLLLQKYVHEFPPHFGAHWGKLSGSASIGPEDIQAIWKKQKEGFLIRPVNPTGEGADKTFGYFIDSLVGELLSYETGRLMLKEACGFCSSRQIGRASCRERV